MLELAAAAECRAAQHLPASCLNRMAQHQMGGGEGGGPGHEGSSPGGHGGGDPYGGAMNSLMPSMPGHDGAMMPGGGNMMIQQQQQQAMVMAQGAAMAQQVHSHTAIRRKSFGARNSARNSAQFSDGHPPPYRCRQGARAAVQAAPRRAAAAVGAAHV